MGDGSKSYGGTTSDNSDCPRLDKRQYRFLGVVICLAFALRFIKIGSQSLWVDEVITLLNSIPGVDRTIWGELINEFQGPLHSAIVYLCHFISMNDAWLRVPSAIAGVWSVYYFYRWIEVWLDSSIARLSTILLVLHPLHIHYSQELRNYAFLFLFAAAASFFFHRLMKEHRKRNWIYYVITITLATLSNFSATFLFVTHTVIYFLRKGINRTAVIRWIFVVMSVLLLTSPWTFRIHHFINTAALVTPVMPGQLSDAERIRGETTVPPAALPYTSYVFSVGYSMGPSLRELHWEHRLAPIIMNNAAAVIWVVLLFGSLSLIGLFALKSRRRQTAEILLYIGIPVLLTLILSWQNVKVYNVRYVLVSLPAYLCVITVGIRSFRPPVARILTILVTSTLLYSLGNYYFDGRYAKEDIRQATKYLEENAEDTDCILTSHPISLVYKHYRRTAHPIYLLDIRGEGRDKQIDKQLRAVVMNCDTVWYIRARDWFVDRE